jgi:hypothetical protein
MQEEGIVQEQHLSLQETNKKLRQQATLFCPQ